MVSKTRKQEVGKNDFKKKVLGLNGKSFCLRSQQDKTKIGMNQIIVRLNKIVLTIEIVINKSNNAIEFDCLCTSLLHCNLEILFFNEKSCKKIILHHSFKIKLKSSRKKKICIKLKNSLDPPSTAKKS